MNKLQVKCFHKTFIPPTFSAVSSFYFSASELYPQQLSSPCLNQKLVSGQFMQIESFPFDVGAVGSCFEEMMFHKAQLPVYVLFSLYSKNIVVSVRYAMNKVKKHNSHYAFPS